MNPKASTSGKVFDKMDRLCTYLLAYEPNCPAKYRQSLWLRRELRAQRKEFNNLKYSIKCSL